MKLEKIPAIPDVDKIVAYKILLIKYCEEQILRWTPLELKGGGYAEHTDIEKKFREELTQLRLPETIEKISGDMIQIYPNKRINISSKGSFNYEDADCNLIKQILQEGYPDYNITIKGK